MPSPLEAPIALSEETACPARCITFALAFRLRFEAHADAREPHEELVRTTSKSAEGWIEWIQSFSTSGRNRTCSHSDEWKRWLRRLHRGGAGGWTAGHRRAMSDEIVFWAPVRFP